MSGIPLGEWSGSSATRELHETIKQFTESSDKQAQAMIKLTWAILLLTALMFGGLIVQIGLAMSHSR
ncbi:hypothetical protein [Mesorhizobium sp. Cs1299R1N3]|uniref:hypothetical protein n=1 Tax=Mesorhizobium sp. Cs1299R1N3 TaxID=3015173 RepID=UPI00301D1412